MNVLGMKPVQTLPRRRPLILPPIAIMPSHSTTSQILTSAMGSNVSAVIKTGIAYPVVASYSSMSHRSSVSTQTISKEASNPPVSMPVSSFNASMRPR